MARQFIFWISFKDESKRILIIEKNKKKGGDGEEGEGSGDGNEK